MQHEPVIVLKLGGSFLLDESRLTLAVHEIYRWRREGQRVVAVVSAFAGRTDAYTHEAEALGASTEGHAAAARLVCGENESASHLGLYLERTGVDACVLAPAAFGFEADVGPDGTAIDGVPRRLDRGRLDAALQEHGVVVVPGYYAHDELGRVVLLGRGGSDLTALVIARELGAERCLLLKDVDGLYESDPRGSAERPRRYASATWEDALSTDGTIVQHKALLHAQAHGLELELGRWNGTRPSRIGDGRTRWSEEPDVPSKLRVGLLGCGVVGGGVLSLLERGHDAFTVARIATRREVPANLRREGVVYDLDPACTVEADVDVIVEALGGVEPARTCIEAALSSGKHVVTANKAVIAQHGRELSRIAADHGVTLRFSAAAGGGVPFLERVSRLQAPLRSLDAILNGTTNFVLERVGQGRAFEAAVEEAQVRGFAEKDPTRDLSGRDAADKLVLLHHVATGAWLDPAQVVVEPVTERTQDEVARAGACVRHLATLTQEGSGPDAAWYARVRPVALAHGHPLARARGEGNAAWIRTEAGEILLHGKGAGRWPTAEAVVGDLLELAREPAWRALPGASGAFLEEMREPCNARGGRAVPGIASRVP